MAIKEIPINPVSNGSPFRLQLPLRGSIFWADFFYNARCGFWTLHFYDAGLQPILMGVRGIADYPLLIRSSSERKPVGQLYLRDTSGQKKNPGPYDIGARVRFVYDDGIR